MKLMFTFRKAKMLLLLPMLFIVFNVYATQRTWIGLGYSGAGATGNSDLFKSTNWFPFTGALAATDTCIMTFSTPGSYLLTQSGAINVSALSVTLSGTTSATGITNVTITLNQTQTISKFLSITNSSKSSFNDEIDLNITAGTTTCGSVITTASGTGSSSLVTPYLNINIGANATLSCLNSWTSTATSNANTTTFIKNSSALTINGVDSVSNSGNKPIRFLVDNSPAITTFNARVKLGTTKKNAYPGDSSIIFLGGYNNSSTGEYLFNVNNDSTVFGYNMGTENFNSGTFLFTGTGQSVNSYSNASTSPDCTPGSFKVGTSVPANITFSTIGDNAALSVYDSLVINKNSIFSIQAAVIPSEKLHKAVILVAAGSTFNVGANAGGQSSSLPNNYLKYLFDSTSTVNFSGTTQNVYSGANYGNVTLSGSGLKKGGGSLTILGNLLITDSAVFDLNYSGFTNSQNFTDSVCGNWTNNSADPSGGVISSGVGKVTIMFNGTPNATIGGTNAASFYGIQVNKNAATTSVSLNTNLTVSNDVALTSGVLNINGNTLTVNGAFSGSGTLTGSTSSGLSLGGAAGTINFTPGGTANYLKTFTLNTGATATLGSGLNIAAGTYSSPGTVVCNGSLATAGLLTLKSDANGDARIGYSTGKITDSTTVERYIPARRAWRFLGVPFSSSTQTINAAWQEGQTNTNPYACPTNDPAPAGFGTEITYNNIAGTGYDYNLTTNPSLKVWVNNAWTTPANTNSTNITSFYGAYCIFVRGDRTICLSNGVNAIPNTTVLRAKGVLNQIGGTNAVKQSYTGKALDFFFLSNPYASSINLQNVISSRANGFDANKFWVWDPKEYGKYGDGAYVTYSNGTWTPSGGSYPSGNNNKPMIQSGQAFMVQLSSGSSSATVQFQENDKDSAESNVTGKQAGSPYPVIYTNLMTPYNGSMVLTDGVASGFANRFSAAVDGDDAIKLWNFSENIALVRGNYALAIEFRPIPKLTDTLFYRLYLKQQHYTLQVFSQNLTPVTIPGKAWLVDKYLNTRTLVKLTDTTLYRFTPNADTNSYRNRFMLVFDRQFTATPVPVTKTVNEDNPDITGISKSAAKTGNVILYPNPVTNGKATLQFSGMDKDNYAVTIYNANGQKLENYSIQHEGGNGVYSLLIPTGWPGGLYTVNVIEENLKKTINLKLVINSN
jgi:hypothetical protein